MLTKVFLINRYFFSLELKQALSQFLYMSGITIISFFLVKFGDNHSLITLSIYLYFTTLITLHNSILFIYNLYGNSNYLNYFASIPVKSHQFLLGITLKQFLQSIIVTFPIYFILFFPPEIKPSLLTFIYLSLVHLAYLLLLTLSGITLGFYIPHEKRLGLIEIFFIIPLLLFSIVLYQFFSFLNWFEYIAIPLAPLWITTLISSILLENSSNLLSLIPGLISLSIIICIILSYRKIKSVLL